MASHFSWYPSSDSVTIPWNARFAFPSQANKTMKMTSRIPPKNGSVFTPGQVIRLEFPAQGYVNPTHTTIEFDVTLEYHATEDVVVRFQNNIQSIFSRVRVMYGSTPLEDIINYNVVVRNLTEWTSGNPHFCMDQSTIAEGIGGITWAADNDGSPGPVNVRSKYIQGKTLTTGAGALLINGVGWGKVPNSEAGPGVPGGLETSMRRYQIQLATGLFTQEKLIPTKFMASQLAIEITLAQARECIFRPQAGNATSTSPTYWVTDVNLIPEVLEFDGSYDDLFLQGLQSGGVPIKFASWHTFIFSSSKSANVNLQVQERSRSVKAIFAVQRRAEPSYDFDNGATFFDTGDSGASTLQNYQYRIGSRFFPASPVQCSSAVGSAFSNGGAEAYVELQKALNIIGDYRLSTPVNASRWALQSPNSGALLDLDFTTTLQSINPNGALQTFATTQTDNCFTGDLGSHCFTMAISLETSSGLEISGLNAEEQSDIALIAYWRTPQQLGVSDKSSLLEVYTYYDAMIVLRENNVLELIQ